MRSETKQICPFLYGIQRPGYAYLTQQNSRTQKLAQTDIMRFDWCASLTFNVNF